MLQHIAHICSAFPQVFSIDFNEPLFWFDKTGDKGEESRFADGVAVETNGAILGFDKLSLTYEILFYIVFNNPKRIKLINSQ